MLLSGSFVARAQQKVGSKIRSMAGSSMSKWNDQSTASLDTFSCAVVRLATDVTPNWLLRGVLLLLRYVLTLLLVRDRRFSVVPLEGVGPAGARAAGDGHCAASLIRSRRRACRERERSAIAAVTGTDTHAQRATLAASCYAGADGHGAR